MSTAPSDPAPGSRELDYGRLRAGIPMLIAGIVACLTLVLIPVGVLLLRGLVLVEPNHSLPTTAWWCCSSGPTRARSAARASSGSILSPRARREVRKAAMVSNLLVVLCSEAQTTPVVNAGV